jgi:HAD superfamily hydrolase (TIGR01459 family)
MQLVQNIQEIIDQYDFFILDLWGVIHDGQATYPNVLATLELLKAKDKKVIFLSNAPRRASKAEEVLTQLGIKGDLYIDIITSGEVAYQTFKAEQTEQIKPYFYIGPEKDRAVFDGLNCQEIMDASKAEFVLATGFEVGGKMDDVMPQLKDAARYKLPMLCVNPDKIVVRQDGSVQLCSGLMADEYKQLGGEVTYYGKPYPKVYEHIFTKYPTIDRSKILVVGDALETDIKGAHDNGLDSAWIVSGIHLKDLNIKFGEMPELADLKAMTQDFNTVPNYILPKFGI